MYIFMKYLFFADIAVIVHVYNNASLYHHIFND